MGNQRGEKAGERDGKVEQEEREDEAEEMDGEVDAEEEKDRQEEGEVKDGEEDGEEEEVEVEREEKDVEDGGEEVVVVTGCSRGGIGYEVALAFARKGCCVFATARKRSSMAGPLQQHPRVHILQLDITSEACRRSTVDTIMRKLGRIDILVNNAGILCVAPVAEFPMDVLESTFKTNVYAPISLIQAVVPHMIARRKGKIVNVGSIAGFTPGPWAGGYCASKAALHALSDSLRLELKPFGIHVIIVAPGCIRSNISANSSAIYSGLPKWRFYQPWEENIRSAITLPERSSSTPTEEFAVKMAEAVLKKNPAACFVYGDLSLSASIVYYLPLRIKDYILMRISGLLKKVECLKTDQVELERKTGESLLLLSAKSNVRS